jgi:copper resistance protein D
MSLHGLWIGQVAMAALMNIAFAFAVGSALLGAWLAPDAQANVAPARPAWLRARRSMLAASVVLVLADVGWLLYQAVAISGGTLQDAFGVVPAVLAQTHVGYAWSVAFCGGLVLLLTALAGRASLVRDALLWFAVIAVAGGKAALGHTADAGPAAAVIGLHTVHVLVASVWGGLVIAAGLAVLPALGASTARGILIRTATQMTGMSLLAALLVLVTGALEAARGIGGSLEASAATTWGHVLTLKLSLVALALVLGGLNRYSALPRLRRTASTMDAHTFSNVLYLEALVVIGVFIASAVLAHATPGFVSLG